MPSQQNISNPQRCEFLRRFRTFQYWNNFVLNHHLNITVLNSCKSSDISNRAFPTYLLLAPAYFTFSSGLIRIRSGGLKQELACLVASVAFMFQWQLQEHALDKVRKQDGGHQLCEMHGVQELITKIHQVFSQRLQFAKNTWLLKLTRQASVGAKYHFILCHIWPWFYFYFCVHQVHIILFMFLLLCSQLLLLKRCRPASLDAIFGCDHQGSCTSTFSTPRSLMHRRWCICHLQYVSSSAEMQFIICWWGKGSLNLPGLFPTFTMFLISYWPLVISPPIFCLFYEIIHLHIILLLPITTTIATLIFYVNHPQRKIIKYIFSLQISTSETKLCSVAELRLHYIKLFICFQIIQTSEYPARFQISTEKLSANIKLRRQQLRLWRRHGWILFCKSKILGEN